MLVVKVTRCTTVCLRTMVELMTWLPIPEQDNVNPDISHLKKKHWYVITSLFTKNIARSPIDYRRQIIRF